MEVLKKKKYLGIAGLVCLLFGILLPFFKIKYYSLNRGIALISGWEGWIILLMIITSTAIIFSEAVTNNIPQLYETSFGKQIKAWGTKGVLAPALVSALIIFITCIRVKSYLGGYKYIDFNKYVSYGIGFYLSIIGVLCLLAHAFLYEGEGGIKATTNTPQPYNPVNNTPYDLSKVQHVDSIQPTINVQPAPAVEQPSTPEVVSQPTVEQPSASEVVSQPSVEQSVTTDNTNNNI